MSGDATNEDRPSDWVWSCLNPEHAELTNYYHQTSVWVTLQVWAEVLGGENGVVRSQHARIIGYAPSDYYYVLFRSGEVEVDLTKTMIPPDPHERIRLRGLPPSGGRGISLPTF